MIKFWQVKSPFYLYLNITFAGELNLHLQYTFDPFPYSLLYTFYTIYFEYFLQYFFVLGKSLQLAENGSTSLFQITEKRKPGPNCTSPPRRSFWRGTSSGPGQYQVSRVRCYEHNMMLWAQYDFLHVVINKVLQLPRSRKTLHESSCIES